MSMPEASTPSASAVLPLTTICASVDRTAGIRYLKSRLLSAQAKPASNSPWLTSMTFAVLLAERERDLLAAELRLEAVQVAQHPEHEHVLALARIGDQLVALALERNFVDAETRPSSACRPFRHRTRRPSDRDARATCPRAGSARPAFSSPARTRPSSTCSLNATTRSVSSPPLVTCFVPMRMRMPDAPATLRAGG